MNKHEAIRELNPSVVNIKGDTAYDVDGNEVSYDQTAVDNLIASKQYREDRVYPSIGEQLDMIFHAGQGGDEFQAAIQAVKDAHPKPTE